MKYCNYRDVTSVYSLNSQKLPGRFSYDLGTRLWEMCECDVCVTTVELHSQSPTQGKTGTLYHLNGAWATLVLGLLWSPYPLVLDQSSEEGGRFLWKPSYQDSIRCSSICVGWSVVKWLLPLSLIWSTKLPAWGLWKPSYHCDGCTDWGCTWYYERERDLAQCNRAATVLQRLLYSGILQIM